MASLRELLDGEAFQALASRGSTRTERGVTPPAAKPSEPGPAKTPASPSRGRSVVGAKRARGSRGRPRKLPTSELEQVTRALAAHRARLDSLAKQVRTAHKNGDPTGISGHEKSRLVVDLGALAERIDRLDPGAFGKGTRTRLMKDVLTLYIAAKKLRVVTETPRSAIVGPRPSAKTDLPRPVSLRLAARRPSMRFGPESENYYTDPLNSK